jgi:hypothetical protein
MFNASSSSLFSQLHALPASASGASIQALSSISFESESAVIAWSSLTSLLTFSTLWKVLLVIHLVANFKLFPFIYHLRILNAVRFVLRSQRPKDDVKPEQLFQPLIISTKSPLMEIDVYGHKVNGSKC